MNKTGKRIYWTQREWEKVHAEFIRLPAVNPQMVERRDLLENAQLVLPVGRQQALTDKAMHRLYWLLTDKNWKVHPHAEKQALLIKETSPVQALPKPMELPASKKVPKSASDLGALLKSLEAVNEEIVSKQAEERKQAEAFTKLFDENKTLKVQLDAARKANPVAEAILHVEARFAGMLEDHFRKLTTHFDAKLAGLQEKKVEVTGKTLMDALGPVRLPEPALGAVGGSWAPIKPPKHDPSPTPTPKAKKSVLISGLVPSMLLHYQKELPGVDLVLLEADKVPTKTAGEFDLILHVVNGVCNHQSRDYLVKHYGRDKVQFIKKGQNRIVSAIKSKFMMA